MDYTNQILALQRARIDMQTEKKIVEVEVKQKYAEQIQHEIQERVATAERIFAGKLKDATDAGIPQSLIRKEVLRTNVWERWTYWRDLAQIEPERVKTQNARETAKIRERGYEWNDDYSVLTLLQLGEKALPYPLHILDWSTSPLDISLAEDVFNAYRRWGGGRELDDVGKEAIRLAFEEGRITSRKSNYDLYRDKEISAEEFLELREKEKEVNSEWLQFIE